ncbi:hypothetical protein ABZ342_26535 [Amycolatopsis sp. NPDC005961]
MTTTEVSAADHTAVTALTQRLVAARVHQVAGTPIGLPVPAAITSAA